jgi:mono/diheme cytochrome c family protein
MSLLSRSRFHGACAQRVAFLLLALAACVTAVASTAAVAEPVLDIAIGRQSQHLSRNDLLKNPALRTIEVPSDVAYQRKMRYRALPLAALIGPAADIESVQFIASDGFVANIPGKLLAGGAQPWLAVEPENGRWPALKPGGPSAGPFYLVWLAPEKSGISPEQWPYQIAKIAQAGPLEQRYPQIVPAAPADSAAQRGLQVFVANCAACHRINGGGDAAIGPDLNRPFNPTNYLQPVFLRRLIREPAAVRNWPGRRMPGFATSVLSDAQLDDLIAYLKQMAQQR